MDLGDKGPKENMVGDAVLCIKGRGRLDCQRLARVGEGANNKEIIQTQGVSKGRHIDKEKNSS